MFITVITTALHPNLKQLILVHKITKCFSTIHFNIGLTFTSRSSNYSHILMFNDKNFIHISLTLCASYMSRLFNPFCFIS